MENCKLPNLCMARMQSIIASCSSAIIMYLTIPVTRKLENAVSLGAPA